jgi:hypothetical protein
MLRGLRMGLSEVTWQDLRAPLSRVYQKPSNGELNCRQSPARACKAGEVLAYPQSRDRCQLEPEIPVVKQIVY